MSLYEKLLDIQKDLKVSKTHYNGFAEFNYRSCEDILKELKPYLEKHKMIILLSDDIECKGSNRIYVTATAQLIDIETGEKVEVCASAREPDVPKKKTDESQATGAASSYARKYALNGLFALDDGIDSDDLNDGKDEDEKTELITNEQIEELRKLGFTDERLIDMAKYYKVKDVNEISKKDAAETIEKQKRISAKEGAANGQ